MEKQTLQKNTKLTSSRILKYTLIVIFTLSLLYLISTTCIYLLATFSLGEITEYQAKLIEKLCDFIHIDVAAAIGTIATAVVARYGLREVASNLSNKSIETNVAKKDP